jgi:hypothetical protein
MGDNICARFFTSYLSVNETLPHSGFLFVKQKMAQSGRTVVPVLSVESERQLEYVDKMVQEYDILKKDRDNRLPKDAVQSSRKGGFSFV